MHWTAFRLGAGIGGDMSIDVSTIDGIIKAYYEIVSIPKGSRRRLEDDKYIHSNNPLILIPSPGGESFKQLTIQDYHAQRPPIAEQSFFEKEIHRITQQFGAMAHVWSTYEWNRGPDSQEKGRGINSIQLYHSENRWWVAAWIFVSEDSKNPLPKDYEPDRISALILCKHPEQSFS